jgi:hypothetical protein
MHGKVHRKGMSKVHYLVSWSSIGSKERSVWRVDCRRNTTTSPVKILSNLKFLASDWSSLDSFQLNLGLNTSRFAMIPMVFLNTALVGLNRDLSTITMKGSSKTRSSFSQRSRLTALCWDFFESSAVVLKYLLISFSICWYLEAHPQLREIHLSKNSSKKTSRSTT